MLDIQQKRKVRSFMYHRVTLAALFVFTIFVVHSTWSVYQKKVESEEKKDISLKHVEELRLRDTDLSTKIDRLSTTPGIEEEIRSKFTVAKNQENIVVVVESPTENVATSTIKLTFWKKLKNFFWN